MCPPSHCAKIPQRPPPLKQLKNQDLAPPLFLSALHGLVNPDTMLAPYEMALNNMNVAERKAWADTVRPNLPPGHLVYFAGECYRKYLPDGEVPMKPMGIGMQLQWLTNKG